MLNYTELKEAIENLQGNVDGEDYDLDKAIEEYHRLEESLVELDQDNWEEHDLSRLKNIMNVLKDQLEIYDPEAELDRMFPNRGDDDFDDDETSGSSFFKD